MPESMRRRSELILVAAAVLAFSQGCGSCVGEATPTEKQTAPAATLGPAGQKFLKTTATENKGMTLDGTTAASMQKDQ